ncbi:MAG: zinc metallopeptidase [Clostridia bacterium]|nr:zinc metallopeptidase [Clostridia bacterium]
MPYFFMDYYYIILVIPAMLLALWAQVKVKSTYNKFSKVSNTKGITGAYAAQAVLTHYGINDVRIEQVSGKLTDHYDPKAKVIRLSEGVYGSSTIAAVGIACHEAGHAAQHAQDYAPIKIRNSLVPVCNIGSSLGIPLALIGYFLGFEPLISIGLLLYAAIALFQVVTLPVELNASRRAMKVIDETGLLQDEEQSGAKKVLTAAAMTYIASMLVAIANLLRLILRFNNRRN